MKLKKLFDKALVYVISACIIFLLLTLFAQALSLAFYALIFLIGIGLLAYLLLRNDKCPKP